jgi:hypothetical protein
MLRPDCSSPGIATPLPNPLGLGELAAIHNVWDFTVRVKHRILAKSLYFMDINKEMQATGLQGTQNLADWVALAKVDGQRVRLPPEFAKLAGVDGVSPESSIDCWLLVLKPGRFKLLKQSPPPTNGPIADILHHWEELVTHDSDDNESDQEIAIRARLLSCVVTWHQRGPRINLPKEVFQLAIGERSHIYLLKVAGAVELWFPDTLQRAVSMPISEVLS